MSISEHPSATEAEPAHPSALTPLEAAPEPTSPRRPRRFRTFDSLIEVPAFRWYLLSMTGNWSSLQMQQVVRGVLAYELTGSYAALGSMELASSVPRVLLAVSGGVVADRASRRVIIQFGQVFNAMLSGILAGLLFMGMLRFEHLIIAAMVQGVSNSFVMPARQSMIPEIVGTGRLTNAFGLNVFVMNVTRLAAPALAGVLIAVIGPGWVFTLMGVLYLLAVFAMFRVPKISAFRREQAAIAEASRSLDRASMNGAGPRRRGRMEKLGVRDIQEAFGYLKTQRVLWMLLVVHMFLSILGMPYQRLLPGFVDDVLSDSFEQTAVRVGLLLAMTAIGALIGSLVIASLPNRNRGKLLIASMTVFALALLAFSVSEVLWVSAGLVVILGIGQSGRQSLNNVLIQTHVSEQYRGRISSIMLLQDGFESLGIFGIALAASAFGVQTALAGTALGMLLLAAILWFGTSTYRRLQ